MSKQITYPAPPATDCRMDHATRRLQSSISAWGCPALDLFATIHNRRLPAFVSPLPHPQAWATDALAMDWNDLHAYLFPPFTMLLQVLRKIQNTTSGEFILIVPCWLAQPWFPLLLEVIIDHPINLPLHPDLVTQGSQRHPHPYLAILHLHVWKLSSVKQRLLAFQGTLPKRSLLQYESPLPQSTTKMDNLV